VSYADLAEVLTLRPLAGDLPFDAEKLRRRSQFSASWSSTVGQLAGELRVVRDKKAPKPVLEIAMTEADFRLDGLPRANALARHPGVVLSFRTRWGDDVRYVVDTFDRWQDNVRAIALSLQALRAVDRYGVTKRGEQYAGWKQLPAGATPEGDPVRGQRLIVQLGGLTAALRHTHPDTREAGFTDRDFQDVLAAKPNARMAVVA
jgi:hypothetical protein